MVSGSVRLEMFIRPLEMLKNIAMPAVFLLVYFQDWTWLRVSEFEY